MLRSCWHWASSPLKPVLRQLSSSSPVVWTGLQFKCGSEPSIGLACPGPKQQLIKKRYKSIYSKWHLYTIDIQSVQYCQNGTRSKSAQLETIFLSRCSLQGCLDLSTTVHAACGAQIQPSWTIFFVVHFKCDLRKPWEPARNFSIRNLSNHS